MKFLLKDKISDLTIGGCASPRRTRKAVPALTCGPGLV